MFHKACEEEDQEQVATTASKALGVGRTASPSSRPKSKSGNPDLMPLGRKTSLPLLQMTSPWTSVRIQAAHSI